jgi:hypothetical protein
MSSLYLKILRLDSTTPPDISQEAVQLLLQRDLDFFLQHHEGLAKNINNANTHVKEL